MSTPNAGAGNSACTQCAAGKHGGKNDSGKTAENLACSTQEAKNRPNIDWQEQIHSHYFSRGRKALFCTSGPG